MEEIKLNSSESVHNFLRYPAHKQTNKQTDKQAERGENITSFTFGGGGNNPPCYFGDTPVGFQVVFCLISVSNLKWNNVAEAHCRYHYLIH